MIIVHIAVHVLPGTEADFIEATKADAAGSLTEPGIVRFDLVQEVADPARFTLVEAYRDEQAVAAHKLTPHYAIWRDAVAPLMAAPRTSVKYTDVVYPC